MRVQNKKDVGSFGEMNNITNMLSVIVGSILIGVVCLCVVIDYIRAKINGDKILFLSTLSMIFILMLIILYNFIRICYNPKP